jgi:hypothetical protein
MYNGVQKPPTLHYKEPFTDVVLTDVVLPNKFIADIEKESYCGKTFL